jgi:hypothetical protein
MRSHQCVVGIFGRAVEDKRDLQAAVQVAVDAFDHGGGLGQVDQKCGGRATERCGNPDELSDA